MPATAVATVAGSFASLIKPGAEVGLRYAEALLKGITPETFAHMPSKDASKGGTGKDINSPAFNIGHLSIYPDLRILPLLGREDLVRPMPYSIDQFKAGAPCIDCGIGEPGAYPSMDVIVATYFDRYRAVLDVLPSVADSMTARENPLEGRMREIFPTVGAVVTFLLVGHPQAHLGQISIWRRLMGHGSAL
ncbi:MAG: hypothetical protein SGJ11_10670 [Phycisphaerae bacterium]|nr:hypothetical protein [Phycisphaerae bacterium]